MFDAIVYYTEHLPLITAFLFLEENDNEGESLSALQQFFAKSYKKLRIETFFVKALMQRFITAIKIFETDLALGMLIYDYIEQITIESEVQVELFEESLDEIIGQLTETFTRNEKEDIVIKLSEASESAKLKIRKYFDNDSGVYTGRKFLKSIQFFNPKLSLCFDEIPVLPIPVITDVPAHEFKLYRSLARDFA